MNCTYLSDERLLSKLIGVRECRRLYRGTLQPLFADSLGQGTAHEKCGVARVLSPTEN